MSKSIVVFFLTSFLVSSLASAQLICANILTTQQNQINSAIENLCRFRLDLESAKARGSSSLALTAQKKDYEDKHAELVKYLEENQIMTRAELQEKMRKIISKLQTEAVEQKQRQEEDKEKEEQNKIVKEALDPINLMQKMNFNLIKPGSFKMGYRPIDTEITKPFEMMTTLVTQLMWAKLKIAMGEKDLDKINPAHFKTGAGSTIVKIGGVDVQMKPDHPIEMVGWAEVNEFIKDLNRLSKIGDPETQKLLENLIPGHQKSDVYDLPTDAQWEFVMRNRGLADKRFFDQKGVSELSDYAWIKENSGNQTHAVANRLPRMIDGQPFYDLEGNVREWTKDLYATDLMGGKDPQADASTRFAEPSHVFRGGSFCSWNADELGSSYRNRISNDLPLNYVGFRLVRYR